MSDLAAIITAGSGAVGLLGGGIAWLWARVEKGFAKHELDLAECRQRERKFELAMKVTGAKYVTVIELLWQEIERLVDGEPNAVLGRARKKLDELKEETDA